jgi:hypothetical protein
MSKCKLLVSVGDTVEVIKGGEARWQGLIGRVKEVSPCGILIVEAPGSVFGWHSIYKKDVKVLNNDRSIIPMVSSDVKYRAKMCVKNMLQSQIGKVEKELKENIALLRRIEDEQRVLKHQKYELATLIDKYKEMNK